MPAFVFANRRFNNPVELALHALGGKWKMPILWRLRNRVWRYHELWRDLPRITHKMLAQQLRELEDAGLLLRRELSTSPRRVEYEITELGRSAVPAIESLRAWGTHYRAARRSAP